MTAFVAGGGLGPWRLCARLLVPFFTYTHLAVLNYDPPGLLAYLRLDPDGYANDFINIGAVSTPGFPYGYDVEPD